jgi:pilus assembly protein CpaB
VYVVREAIPKGTDGSQAVSSRLIRQDQIPLEFRPATAVSDLGLLAGKVALVDLTPGQVVVDGMFVDQSQAFVTFADRVDIDKVAITVSLDQVHGVAGLLVPGDKVNMLVVDPEGQTNETPTSDDGEVEGGAAGYARFLYQNVEVLAIGQVAAADPGAAEAPANPGSDLITFMVPPDAAQRIALAGTRLYLTLAPKDYQPVDLRPVTEANLFDTGSLTPSPAGD